MSSWRSWWTALSVALAVQMGCGGESEGPGDSDSGRSGSAGRGGAKGGSAGSTNKGGRAGTGSSEAGDAGELGVGGTVAGGAGVAGSVTVGGFGGSAGVTATGGTGIAGTGVAGVGGTTTPPFNWYCGASTYGDGECDCGCGTKDIDCKDGYDLGDCDTCNVPGSCNSGACPGRIDEENPAACAPAPDGWKCPDYAYSDAQLCDCGCGILDPDCEDEDKENCDICNLPGSCSDSQCANSSVDEEDNTKCDIPEGWTCSDVDYLDGDCHCGCGVVDADCPSVASSVCDQCTQGCAETYCPGPIDAENNAICTGVPARWACDPRFWDDGSLCHCGCGAVDPDCADETADACDRCNFEGSCSAQACPGTIDPDENWKCEAPDPPGTWVCYRGQYADGVTCDCGCGAMDLDCARNDPALCESCYTCGTSCPGRVNPEDISQCIQPPSEWTCADYRFGDGSYCDCGCGVRDPDCPSELATACNNCPAESCSPYDCSDLNPTDNARCNPSAPEGWSCDPDIYGDGDACDCGCGVVDVDCSSADKSACDICQAGESCSPPGCATINQANNAICD